MINNYFQHCEKHLCQGVGDSYIFVIFFIKNTLTINPIIFYVTSLSRHVVVISRLGTMIPYMVPLYSVKVYRMFSRVIYWYHVQLIDIVEK